MSDVFGELRSLLASGQPCEDLFSQVCLVLGDEGAAPPALSYLQGHLERWPDDIRRRMPWRWRERLARGEPCAQAILCDTLTWARAPEEPAVEPKSLERLLARPEIGSLRFLDLGRARIGPRGSVALANSPHLEALEVLCLDSTSALARGLEALLTTTTLPNWRALYVSAEGSLQRTHERMQARPEIAVARYGPPAHALTWQIETLLRPHTPSLLDPTHIRTIARYGGALAARRPGWHACYFLARVAERLARLGERGVLATQDIVDLGGPSRWQVQDAETLLFRALELSDALPHACDIGWIFEGLPEQDETTTLVVERFIQMLAERPFEASRRRRFERLMPLLELENARRLFEAWGLEGEALQERLELHLSTD